MQFLSINLTLYLQIIFRDTNLALTYEYWLPEDTYKAFKARQRESARSQLAATDPPPPHPGVAETLAQDAPHYDSLSDLIVGGQGQDDAFYPALSDLDSASPVGDNSHDLSSYGFVEGAGHKYELRQGGAGLHGEKSNAIPPHESDRGLSSSERKHRQHGANKKNKGDERQGLGGCKIILLIAHTVMNDFWRMNLRLIIISSVAPFTNMV